MNTDTTQLPKISDPRGNLSFLEDYAQIPFGIKRVHWIYDVPGGAERGGVAYDETEEFIIALSGSFDVVIDNGLERQIVPLNRSYYGVYVPRGVWRGIENFSTNAIAVIAASTHYNPDEGIRDYETFKLHAQRRVDSYRQTIHECTEAMGFSPSKYRVYDCNIIELDKHHSDSRGNISVVENSETVPFEVKRIYYLYDIPGGEDRGGHAHRELNQLIVAVSGSFTVTLDDGNVKRSFTLNRPYHGLLVKPGIWRTLNDFSSGSVCLVLASEKYDEGDYIRDYKDFIEFRKGKE